MEIKDATKILLMLDNLDLWNGYEIVNIELDTDDSINFTMKGGANLPNQ